MIEDEEFSFDEFDTWIRLDISPDARRWLLSQESDDLYSMYKVWVDNARRGNLGTLAYIFGSNARREYGRWWGT